MQNQWVQSLGQFLIVFVSGLMVYKTWNEVVAFGIMNAIWQPMLQGVSAALAIWGFAKIAARGGQP